MLLDDWLKRRQLMAALGVKAEDMDVLDDLAAAVREPDAPPPEPSVRAAQVAAFIHQSGAY